MYDQFVKVKLTNEIKEIAKYHAFKREENIVRQFQPGKSAPASDEERQYIGCIGELSVKKYLNLEITLDDTYDKKITDQGDVTFKGLNYDVKCTARKSTYYHKLYTGSIKPYEPYAMIDYTSKHLHHLHKYTGGVIFTTFDIPDHASKTKINGQIRDLILSKDYILILGYLKQNEIKIDKQGNIRKPTWRGPKNPDTDYQVKYRSPNYIYHHTELRSLKELHV